LDTKWKMVTPSLIDRDRGGRSDYGLSQADFYQLFAYGHNYFGGQGDLLLIYPQTKSFTRALQPFSFSERLTLWVVPFDLDGDVLDAAGAELPLRTLVEAGIETGHPVRARAVA
jgi:5-methylcytosine-specific restriction enzyme subunit McrC